ncbi:hypothetical protein D3C85_860270 [compost metagenome]
MFQFPGAQYGAQGLPALGVVGGHHDPSIKGLVGLVGCGVGGGAARLGGCGVRGKVRRVADLLQHQRCVVQADVEGFALAAALRRVVCRQNRNRGHIGRDHVGDRRRDFYRLAVRDAQGTHQAAGCLDDAVYTGPAAQRTGLSIRGNRAIHQAAVALGQRVVVQTKRLHDARTVVFNHHVRAADQAARDLATAVGFQIQRDAALVAIHTQVHGAFARDPGWADLPAKFPAGRFDFDDVRAHVRKHHGADGAREDVREIHDPEVSQATFEHVLSPARHGLMGDRVLVSCRQNRQRRKARQTTLSTGCVDFL